jgi:hypothetical protein
MAEQERLLMMAEDELTQYSTDARKIEKLRRKIALSVPLAQQREIKAALMAEFPTDFFSRLMVEQRQTLALPFWGIAGLGLLLGISWQQPLDFLATVIAGGIAIAVQRKGWNLMTRRLLIQTLAELDPQAPNSTPSS